MTYTGLELFMDNLMHLSYSQNPIVNNNTAILSKRPQMQRLYQELGYIMQMFVEEQNLLHETEQVRNLKTRFKDAAHEAHMIVGLFVYSTNYISATCQTYSFFKRFLSCMKIKRSTNNQHSLNLDNVMASLNSIKEEFTTIFDNQKMDSSKSIDRFKAQTVVAGTSSARNPSRMKKVLEETVVGLIRDAELVRDKLVEDQKQLDVVSIVGMGGGGGLGNTTLATKLYNDPFLVYHFHIRAWVTVSQTYERRDLLIQLVASVCTEFDPYTASDSKLREKLHKSLMGKRYLIDVDDVWSIQAWDDLELFFPNHNNGSRILLTSRLREVALHAKSHGFVHQLEFLTDVESWELLRKKVFHGNDFLLSLIEPGKEIAKKCHGLPLAVVVIAGVLAKEARSKDSWKRIAERVSSYIVSDHHGNMDIFALSYDHLPPHLRDCFLYLGGFPEGHKFRVQNLIWLWMAEGFVEEDGKRSLEEIGEDYLMELVDRNLVVVTDRKFSGAIKACSVHDLLRELCLERATKGHFCMKISTLIRNFSSMRQYKPRRIFTNQGFEINRLSHQPFPWVHSILWFHKNMSLINITNRYFSSYPLLMVLDLQKCQLQEIPQAIGLLVHLRYFAFWYTKGFPSSICNIWSLQTIIVISPVRFRLPNTISNLVNLRHLWSDGYIYFPSVEKPMNLQTISNVALCNTSESWDKCFPRISKLTCTTLTHKDQNFKSLSSLETLMWISTAFRKIHVTFPDSLKKLSLSGCCLPWSDMSIVQSLPNLEVLKVLEHAFSGPKWETGDVPFQHLKFLKLQGLNIKQWEASGTTFPCLTHLVLDTCPYLEGIPLEIGYISTLELIDVDNSSDTVVESLDIIQEDQQNFGNYDLKIKVRNMLHRLAFNRKLRGLAWVVDW